MGKIDQRYGNKYANFGIIKYIFKMIKIGSNLKQNCLSIFHLHAISLFKLKNPFYRHKTIQINCQVSEMISKTQHRSLIIFRWSREKRKFIFFNWSVYNHSNHLKLFLSFLLRFYDSYCFMMRYCRAEII